MELISHFLHQGLSFVIPLVVLLGVLIFVHELGHFSVAKYFGVRVETFSLGFGKKILQKKIGDTIYCVSAIPFGGYVKMFGDDPTTPIAVEEQKYSFNHKPVLPRIAIVLAGPLMNAFFAFVLFTAIATLGEEAIQAKLGDILPHTTAYDVGFRTGDVIEKVADQPVERWDLVKKIIEDSSDKSLKFDINREGNRLQLTATPVLIQNKNVLSTKDHVGDIEGLTYLYKAPALGISNPNSVAAKAGLKTGDIIKSINGKEVESFDLALSLIKPGAHLEVERESTTLKIDLPHYAQKDVLGIESSELFLSNVVAKSGAEKAGIKAGDKIIAIDSTKIGSWEQVIKAVQSYKKDAPDIKVTVLRNGQAIQTKVTPQFVTQQDATGADHSNYALGVVTGLVMNAPHTFLAKEHGLSILTRGFDETVKWTKLTALSFLKLVQRKVSAKSIGGPLMIGKLASDTWKVGLSPFLKIMAIISINLFVLNLLPVPVLDGGHLLFFTIELIKGRALNTKWLEVFQQVGMALLLALMLFSMYNDIVRFFA